MITQILSDFSRVILLPKEEVTGITLSTLYKEKKQNNPNFNFFDYFVFNQAVLDFYTELKKNYSLSIFTSGTMFHNVPDEGKELLKPIFDRVFVESDFGADKEESQSYISIAERLNKKPEEVLFIDDQKVNINAAKKAGLQTIRYINFEQCKVDVIKILIT